MRNSLGMSVLAAVICAAIWIIISFATGGTVLFSLGGGVLLFVVAFIVGYAFRRLVIDRRRPVG